VTMSVSSKSTLLEVTEVIEKGECG
jgi:hypothetical protein